MEKEINNNILSEIQTYIRKQQHSGLYSIMHKSYLQNATNKMRWNSNFVGYQVFSEFGEKSISYNCKWSMKFLQHKLKIKIWHCQFCFRTTRRNSQDILCNCKLDALKNNKHLRGSQAILTIYALRNTVGLTLYSYLSIYCTSCSNNILQLFKMCIQKT